MTWRLLLLFAVIAVLVFLLGRRLEGGRDADWQAAARSVQGEFRSGAEAARLPAAFGPLAPWHEWARTGQLQCPRAVEAANAWLLDVRYSVREARGEASPEVWHEQAMAVLPLPGRAPGPALVPVAGDDAYAAVHDGAHLFVWKKPPPGAGARPKAADLEALLQEARARLTRLSPALPAGSGARPAGPAPVPPRTPPR